MSSTDFTGRAYSRRQLLRTLGLVVAGTSLSAACSPSSTSTAPAAQPTTLSGAAAAKPNTAIASTPPAPTAAAKPTTSAAAQATPGGAGTQAISIEWWRRNYTPGSKNAETVTSDA